MFNIYLGIAVSALIALVIGGAFYAGIYFERQSAELEQLEDYKEGTEDAQDATTDLPVDDSSRIDWLHEWLRR